MLNRDQWPEHSLLGRLGHRDREALLRLGTEVTYRSRQLLLRQGEDYQHALLVVSGSVKVVVHSEIGKDLLVAVRGRGELLGEMTALHRQRRAASVVASGPTAVRVIRGGELAEFLERHGEACLALAGVLSDRLRLLHERWVEMITCRAPTRVLRVLVELVRLHGRRTPEGWELGVPLNQPELASLSGVALSTVEKALRALQERGLLHRSGQRVVISDLARLHQAGVFGGAIPY